MKLPAWVGMLASTIACFAVGAFAVTWVASIFRSVPAPLALAQSAHKDLVRVTPSGRPLRECLEHADADDVPSWIREKLAANCHARQAARETPEYLHALQRFNEARVACFRTLPGEYRCNGGSGWRPPGK